jgi:hypothetical protein
MSGRHTKFRKERRGKIKIKIKIKIEKKEKEKIEIIIKNDLYIIQ